MKVPAQLATAFGSEFQDLIATFISDRRLLPDPTSLQSSRFISRSIVPHVKKLSALFNREQRHQDSPLEPYWKESSNSLHLRLAYFLYFMPSNLYRIASVWAELTRLGFEFQAKDSFRGLELGAGPASGACGIAAGSRFGSSPLPQSGNWALIEQDKQILEWGSEWAKTYFSHVGVENWETRPFHRKINSQQGFLPRTAPTFHLWVMSYYLNELSLSSSQLASLLLKDWDRHLEEEGIVILVEPALKLQSRRLLELRRELLNQIEKEKITWLKILLPCLGHQACGALADPSDWCHEEVTWWRPPYFKQIDKMAGLDRKTLPFSYLVLVKSERPREEILPELGSTSPQKRYRLVSPAHSEGQDLEFFLCGQDGKRRTRYYIEDRHAPSAQLERGDILLDTRLRGDKNSSRLESFEKRNEDNLNSSC